MPPLANSTSVCGNRSGGALALAWGAWSDLTSPPGSGRKAPMTAIADIGSTLEVTPQDEIWIKTGLPPCEFVRDFSPFRMRVDRLLEEHGTLLGVYGPVMS